MASLAEVVLVALHPEGVDRNLIDTNANMTCFVSPSTRRAWIEIVEQDYDTDKNPVALHPEGVDRNFQPRRPCRSTCRVALHPEGVDRNQKFYKTTTEEQDVALHPEGVDRNLIDTNANMTCFVSPSTRRAWIEILSKIGTYTPRNKSPSTRRAWIEIVIKSERHHPYRRRPPPGGRG